MENATKELLDYIMMVWKEKRDSGETDLSLEDWLKKVFEDDGRV